MKKYIIIAADLPADLPAEILQLDERAINKLKHNSKFRLIPIEDRKRLVCYKCGSLKSVKYLSLIDNRNYCNLCILSIK